MTKKHQITIGAYQIGNTHITPSHLYSVLSGSVKVIYYLENGTDTYTYTYTAGDLIYVQGDIPHLFCNCSAKPVTLQLLWMNKTPKTKLYKNLQYKLIFFTGFSCNKNLYKNFVQHFTPYIQHSFSKFLHSNEPPSLEIEFHDWTEKVYKQGLDTYLQQVASQNKDRQLIVMGHSWGCQVALTFANNYPLWIDQLILLDYHPLGKALSSVPNKQKLIDGFFPACSRHTSQDVDKVNSSIKTQYISVSKYITKDKIKLTKNIPLTFVYGTGMKVENNNIIHLCVNKQNQQQVFKMSQIAKTHKNAHFIPLYQSSHFWFLEPHGYDATYLNIWKVICGTICK